MARTVADQKIESPTKRARLKAGPVPYWRAIEPGLHIGYRRGKDIGAWVGRKHIGARAGKAPYRWVTIKGCADDDRPADGVEVLSYPQAVARVREIFAAPKPTGPITVRKACAQYICYLKAERKTGLDAEQRLAKHVLPELGDRLVVDLTTEDVDRVKRGMVGSDLNDPEVERKAKDSANRVMTSLKAALNRAYAEPKNAIPSDAAWKRSKRFARVARRREVFLGREECRRLINVCSGAFKNLVIAALLSGARPPHELTAARVRDFNGPLGTLTVSGKTGTRDIVLTEEAVGFFESICAGRPPDAVLLTRDDGRAWAADDHSNPMREAVARAKLPSGTVLYTLRHTYASAALLAGANMQVLAENMGTSVDMLETNYGKFLPGARRKIIEETALKLGLEQSNVAPLRAR